MIRYYRYEGVNLENHDFGERIMPNLPGATLNKFDKSFLENIEEIHCLEEGTCSHRATQYFLKNIGDQGSHLKTHEWPSFYMAEDGAKKENTRSIILVPHFHHMIFLELTYSDHWKFHQEIHLTIPNPPLYLASKEKPKQKHRSPCTAVQQLKKLLLPEDLIDPSDINDAENTQRAALDVYNKKAKTCITNEHALKKHGLFAIRTLRKLNLMWLCFEHCPQ